jgi:hypothetical protein
VGVLAGRSDLGAHHDALTVASISHTHTVTPAETKNSRADAHSHGDALTSNLLLDAATEAKLEEQLRIARSVALRYPRLTDALRAGYTQALDNGRGIGSRYMMYRLTL